jgi:hypothetical protein
VRARVVSCRVLAVCVCCGSSDRLAAAEKLDKPVSMADFFKVTRNSANQLARLDAALTVPLDPECVFLGKQADCLDGRSAPHS